MNIKNESDPVLVVHERVVSETEREDVGRQVKINDIGANYQLFN